MKWVVVFWKGFSISFAAPRPQWLQQHPYQCPCLWPQCRGVILIGCAEMQCHDVRVMGKGLCDVISHWALTTLLSKVEMALCTMTQPGMYTRAQTLPLGAGCLLLGSLRSSVTSAQLPSDVTDCSQVELSCKLFLRVPEQWWYTTQKFSSLNDQNYANTRCYTGPGEVPWGWVGGDYSDSNFKFLKLPYKTSILLCLVQWSNSQDEVRDITYTTLTIGKTYIPLFKCFILKWL